MSLCILTILSPETEAQINRAEFPNMNSLSSTKLPQHESHVKLLQPEKMKQETQGESLCETSLIRQALGWEHRPSKYITRAQNREEGYEEVMQKA